MRQVVAACCMSMVLFLCTLTTETYAAPEAGEKIVYIVPFYEWDTFERFFNDQDRDDAGKVWCVFRDAVYKHGYQIQFSFLDKALPEDASVLVCDIPDWHPYEHWKKQLPRNTKHIVLYLWEPPTVRIDNYIAGYYSSFGTILTQFDELLYTNYVKKYYFPQPHLRVLSERVPFEQKKLCTMICGVHRSYHRAELYSKRCEIIDYFEKQPLDDFDFYGKGWERAPLRTYKGSVAHKEPVLRKYKFAFCYENMKDQQGYITEKIFDVMVAGCVPIYWGATNIDRYVPRSCYIAAQEYSSLDALYAHIKAIGPEEYTRYLDNIEAYLASDQAYYFSIAYFIDTILGNLLPDYNPTLIFTSQEQQRIQKLRQQDSFR